MNVRRPHQARLNQGGDDTLFPKATLSAPAPTKAKVAAVPRSSLPFGGRQDVVVQVLEDPGHLAGDLAGTVAPLRRAMASARIGRAPRPRRRSRGRARARWPTRPSDRGRTGRQASRERVHPHLANAGKPGEVVGNPLGFAGLSRACGARTAGSEPARRWRARARCSVRGAAGASEEAADMVASVPPARRLTAAGAGPRLRQQIRQVFAPARRRNGNRVENTIARGPKASATGRNRGARTADAIPAP